MINKISNDGEQIVAMLQKELVYLKRRVTKLEEKKISFKLLVSFLLWGGSLYEMLLNSDTLFVVLYVIHTYLPSLICVLENRKAVRRLKRIVALR